MGDDDSGDRLRRWDEGAEPGDDRIEVVFDVDLGVITAIFDSAGDVVLTMAG